VLANWNLKANLQFERKNRNFPISPGRAIT
jgi:hypothetical protein